MKRVLLVALASAGLAGALPASAQFAKPEEAIKYRQSTMSVLGAHFGRIGAMASGRAPFDGKVAAENADVVAYVAKLTFTGFVPGTEKGSKSKPEVWTEADDFKKGAAKMQEEVVKLNAAAKTGDLAQIKATFGAAAKTCKSCHDDFKVQ